MHANPYPYQLFSKFQASSSTLLALLDPVFGFDAFTSSELKSFDCCFEDSTAVFRLVADVTFDEELPVWYESFDGFSKSSVPNPFQLSLPVFWLKSKAQLLVHYSRIVELKTENDSLSLVIPVVVGVIRIGVTQTRRLIIVGAVGIVASLW